MNDQTTPPRMSPQKIINEMDLLVKTNEPAKPETVERWARELSRLWQRNEINHALASFVKPR